MTDTSQVKHRDQIAQLMVPSQIEQAQRLSSENNVCLDTLPHCSDAALSLVVNDRHRHSLGIPPISVVAPQQGQPQTD